MPAFAYPLRRILLSALIGVSFVVGIGSRSRSVEAQEFERGRSLYAEACASCHGGRGEGAADLYDQPLHGDLSVTELAKVIQETMPEDDPGSLSNEDAQSIAVYAHHEFYSPMAQLRNAPPEFELCHLTVDQYRRSVLDLMTPFTHRPAPWNDQRGLERTIHQGDWGKDRKEVEKTVDAQLVFDWGEGKPLPGMDHEKWQVRWSGSLFAPWTGVYEFHLDATLRANLYVNDSSTPLIDATVVSYEKSLNTAPIFLVGGQSYPIALEANHTKEPASRISLQWRTPGGVTEALPAHLLSPTWSPIQLVCATPFPPDDSSIGYERGRNVSREWYEATIAAAIEIGNRLTADLKRWMPESGRDPNNLDQVKAWCRRWVTLALRHPLSEEEQRHYVDAHFEEGASIDTAVKRVCLLALTSPEFLYPGLRENRDEANVAKLALFVWDSVPEEWMLEAAGRGEAHEPGSLATMLDRMMADPRFHQKVRGFLHEYLGTRSLRELSKDASRYLDFNPQIAGDLRTSLQMFLDEFATDPNRDLRTLLTSDGLYVNGPLAQLYGIDLPADAPFQRIAMPSDRFAGAVSHPYLMSGLAYHTASSPIHRGVFLAKRILGRNLRPPVDAIIPLSEEASPGMTTRERVALQTQGAMCQSCHRVINPLGFTLENFDAIGRFRSQEFDREVDAQGEYVASDGQAVAFRGPRELAEFLSRSEEARLSMVRQMFHHMAKQPLAAYGPESMRKLTEDWAGQGCTIRSLVHSLAILGLTSPPIPSSSASQALIQPPSSAKIAVAE